MLHFERVVIGEYELLGNRLSRDMYDNLPLLWEVSPPVPGFSKSDYVKHDYDRDGIFTNGKTFFSGGRGSYSPMLFPVLFPNPALHHSAE
jgi:trans-aconitate 3-methyltransferase